MFFSRSEAYGGNSKKAVLSGMKSRPVEHVPNGNQNARFTVVRETPITSAVSSIGKPPKKRISRMR